MPKKQLLKFEGKYGRDVVYSHTVTECQICKKRKTVVEIDCSDREYSVARFCKKCINELFNIDENFDRVLTKIDGKELKQDKQTLHLYIELKDGCHPEDIASRLQNELINLDSGYRDLAEMMEIKPLVVTELHRGAFGDYYRMRKESGAELAQRKPPRMNAPDYVIRDLVRKGGRQAVYVR